VPTETHSGLKIFTGNSNPALAKDIADQLGTSLGKITVNKFADGEVNVMVNENVRGKDVYIIQPTSPPVNETLMELLLMISTMRRASARKITAVIPYYGYARQDRKMQARVPISAADVARLLEAMGVDRVIAVDLHCGQIQVCEPSMSVVAAWHFICCGSPGPVSVGYVIFVCVAFARTVGRIGVLRAQSACG
jgi:ribose-phosphate pyrophosphokinase